VSTDCQTNEEWRPVPGFEFYEVSSLGRVRSWAMRGHRGRRNNHPSILSPGVSKYGHLRVVLAGRHQESVHVLVAMAFIGPRADAEVCRHLDGNPANNRPENLAWGTHLQNNLDKNKHGTMLRGESHPNSKITDDDVRAIRSSHETISALSRRIGVSMSSVQSIRARKAWTHVE
jgi:hypothetical protein